MGVSLRPNDPFAKKLSSTAVGTQNVLIKVAVPKRTGRKRKRGSSGPFEEVMSNERPSRSITAPDLLRRLRDNSDTCALQPVGVIQDTHRFRNLPDFQVRAEDVPIMCELRDHTMTPKYDQLKQFNIDLKPDQNGVPAFPGPPTFVPVQQPYRYEYQGAAKDEITKAKPEPTPKPPPGAARSRQAVSTLMVFGISLKTTEEVPRGPPASLTRATSHLLQTINALKTVLEQRPIVTVHAVCCLLPNHSRKAIANSVRHVGYYINDDPWRETIVKYGVDPRKEPKYRFYQSLKYSINNVRAHRATLAAKSQAGPGYLFDGQNVPNLSANWQLCDLTDPVLHGLVNTSELRPDGKNEKHGWYHTGTMIKIRVIMFDKLWRIMYNEALLPEEQYKTLASLPNQVEDSSQCLLGPEWNGTPVASLATEVAREVRFGYARKLGRRTEKQQPRDIEDEANDAEAGANVEMEEEGSENSDQLEVEDASDDDLSS